MLRRLFSVKAVMVVMGVVLAGGMWGMREEPRYPWPTDGREVGRMSVHLRVVVDRVMGVDEERGVISAMVVGRDLYVEDAWRTGWRMPLRLRVWAEDVRLWPGQVLEVRGELMPPRPGPWGNDWGVVVRPARDGEGLRVVDEGGWRGRWWNMMAGQRDRMVSHIWSSVPTLAGTSLWSSSRIQAGVVEGLLFGHDHALPREERAHFRETGTMHVMAVSGFNVSVVVGFFFLLLWKLLRLKREWAAGVSAIMVWGLVGLAGATPSVVRAAVMASVVLTGLVMDRKLVPLNGLAAAFVAMTVWDPAAPSDVGFQLSFLATLGIIAGMWWWTDGPRRGRRIGFWASTVIVTVSAQLAVLPVLLLYFHQFSWAAFPINVMLAPFVIGTTIAGGLMVMLAPISTTLAHLAGWVVWVGGSLMVQVVRWGSAWPGASVQVGWWPWWMMAVVYGSMGVWIVRKWRRPRGIQGEGVTVPAV